jgi:hypothetical protein
MYVVSAPAGGPRHVTGSVCVDERPNAIPPPTPAPDRLATAINPSAVPAVFAFLGLAHIGRRRPRVVELRANTSSSSSQ